MKNLVTFCIFILVGVMLLSVLPIHGESEIYDSVVRLHVIANSDSEEDQALKFKVRDGVLTVASELVAECKTRDEAAVALRGGLDAIEDTAQAVVASEGYEYDVSVKLCEEKYPTKNYESVCFPSGSYMSLQVKIGDAVGQNWWCVLFPNLCLSAATKSEAEDAFIQAGLTPEQYKIITDSEGVKYKLRFKFLEIIEQTFGKK